MRYTRDTSKCSIFRSGHFGVSRVYHWSLIFCCLVCFSLPLNAQSLISPQFVYLNKAGGGLFARNYDTGQFLQTIKTSFEPHETALSPNGQYVVVANADFAKPPANGYYITIWDRWLNQSYDIPLPHHKNPHGLAFIDDNTVAVTTQGSNDGVLVNVKTKKIKRKLNFNKMACHMLVYAKQHQLLYVTCRDNNAVIAYDLSNHTVSKTWKDLPNVEPIAMNRDETALWLGVKDRKSVAKLDLIKGEVTHRYVLGDEPIRLALTNDEKRLTVLGLNKGQITTLKANNLEHLNTVPLTGANRAMPISINNTPDNYLMLIGDQGNQRVLLWDLSAKRAKKQWPASAQPDGVRYLAPISPHVTE